MSEVKYRNGQLLVFNQLSFKSPNSHTYPTTPFQKPNFKQSSNAEGPDRYKLRARRPLHTNSAQRLSR